MSALLLPSLARFTELLTDDFARIANAFALVRLGRTEVADLRGDLADALLVDPLDVHAVGPLDGKRDPVRRRVRDRVRITEREVQVVAGLVDAETDALEFERLAKAFRDPVDHVR